MSIDLRTGYSADSIVILRKEAMLGAALSWTTVLWSARISSLSSGAGLFVILFLPPITLTVLLVANRFFDTRRIRVRCVTCAGAVYCLASLLILLLEQVPGLMGPAIPMVLEGFVKVTASMVTAFWALEFAFLAPEKSGKAATATAVPALALFMLSLFFQEDFLQAGSIILITLSTLLYRDFAIEGALCKPSGRRSARQAAPFFLSRMFFGFSIGCAFGWSRVSSQTVSLDPLGGVLVLGVIVALAILFAVIRIPERDLAGALPLSPLLLGGVLIFLFACEGEVLTLIGCTAVIYLSWMMLSATQISLAKTAIGLSETQIAFSERACVYLFMTLGLLLAYWIFDSVPNADIVRWLVVLSYVLLLATTVVLMYYAHELRESVFMKSIQKSYSDSEGASAWTFDETCARFTERFQLTPREADVFKLLASGYNRPSIAKELYISDSTVKSHIASIYDKTMIRDRQRIIQLVQECSQTGQIP